MNVTPKLHLCLHPFQISSRVVSTATPSRWQWSNHMINTRRRAWTVWKCNYSKAGHRSVPISSPSDQGELCFQIVQSNFLCLAFPSSRVMKLHSPWGNDCSAVGRCSSRMHRHVSQISIWLAPAGSWEASTGHFWNKPLHSTWSQGRFLFSTLEMAPSQGPSRSELFRGEAAAGMLHLFDLTSKYHIKLWRAMTDRHCSDTETFQLWNALCPDSSIQGRLQRGEWCCIQRGICLSQNQALYNLKSCTLTLPGFCCYTFQGFFKWLQEIFRGRKTAWDLDSPRYFSIKRLENYPGRVRNHSLSSLKGNEIKPTERQTGTWGPEYHYFCFNRIPKRPKSTNAK